MLVGAATVLIWLYAPITLNGASLSSTLYEIVPGFVMGLTAAVLVSWLGRAVKPRVAKGFDEMSEQMADATS